MENSGGFSTLVETIRLVEDITRATQSQTQKTEDLMGNGLKFDTTCSFSLRLLLYSQYLNYNLIETNKI